MENTRKLYVDVAKGIAIIAVILTHVVPGFGKESDSLFFAGVDSFYYSIARFCVPVFFMCTGILMLRKEKELSLKKLYFHNILRIIVAAAVCGCIYALYDGLFRGYMDGNLWLALLSQIKGWSQFNLGRDFFYWFVYAIIGMYISLPVIKVFTDHAGEKEQKYFLIVWMICCALQNLARTTTFDFLNGQTDQWKFLGVFCGYAGYMVLGNYIVGKDFNKRSRHIIYTLGCCSLVVMFVNSFMSRIQYSGHITGFDLTQYISLTGIFYATSVLVFLKYQVVEIKTIFGKALCWLGANTLLIYLLHYLFVRFFLEDKILMVSLHPIINPVIWVIIILACSVFLVIIVNGLKKIIKRR